MKEQEPEIKLLQFLGIPFSFTKIIVFRESLQFLKGTMSRDTDYKFLLISPSSFFLFP